MGKSRVIFVRDTSKVTEDHSDDIPGDPWKDDSVSITAISSSPAPKLPGATKKVRSGSLIHDNQVSSDGFPSHCSLYAFQDTTFYRGIYPVILPLRIFGLLPIPHTSPAIKGCNGLNLWVVYSVVILLITILHFGRSLSVYNRDEDFGEELFFKLQQSLWYMECVVKTFATVTAFYRKDRLAEFFMSWASVCKDAPPRKPVRHCAMVAAISSLLFVVFNSAGCAFLFYGVDSLEHILMTTVSPLQMNDSNEILLKTLVVIILTIMSAVAMFPVALMCVLMFALYHEFKDVSDTVSSSLEDNGEFIGDLEKLRLHHQKLCKLVQLADKTFSVIIAFAYISNIPNLCIVLYSILYFRSHISLALLNGFWFVFILIHVTTISIFGAWVNSAVSPCFFSNCHLFFYLFIWFVYLFHWCLKSISGKLHLHNGGQQ